MGKKKRLGSDPLSWIVNTKTDEQKKDVKSIDDIHKEQPVRQEAGLLKNSEIVEGNELEQVADVPDEKIEVLKEPDEFVHVGPMSLKRDKELENADQDEAIDISGKVSYNEENLPDDINDISEEELLILQHLCL